MMMMMMMSSRNRYHIWLLVLQVLLAVPLLHIQLPRQHGSTTPTATTTSRISTRTITVTHAFIISSVCSSTKCKRITFTSTRMHNDLLPQRIPLSFSQSVPQKQRPGLPSSSSSSSLMMFLPPGGDGNNNNNNKDPTEWNELTSTILIFVATIAFFVSPLGGIFFTLFNSFIAFLILAPIGALTALNVWEYFNTFTGTCPNCQAPVRVLKNEDAPTICYNCGAIVQAKDGQIYLANLNNNINNNGDDLTPMNQNVFTTFFEEITTVLTSNKEEEEEDIAMRRNDNNAPPLGSKPTPRGKNNNNKNTIIDVDVINDE